jgi:hypothetical protein
MNSTHTTHLIPTENYSMTSTRVWIYQASRNLNEYETLQIENDLKNFTSDWTAHQMPLKSFAEVLFKRFIIFLVDEGENSISGCGIDKSVNLLKEIQQKINIDFFNRTEIAYLSNDEIKTFFISEAQNLFDSKIINSETIIFNNLVSTIAELENEWQQPLSASWIWNRIKK